MSDYERKQTPDGTHAWRTIRSQAGVRMTDPLGACWRPMPEAPEGIKGWTCTSPSGTVASVTHQDNDDGSTTATWAYYTPN